MLAKVGIGQALRLRHGKHGNAVDPAGRAVEIIGRDINASGVDCQPRIVHELAVAAGIAEKADGLPIARRIRRVGSGQQNIVVLALAGQRRGEPATAGRIEKHALIENSQVAMPGLDQCRRRSRTAGPNKRLRLRAGRLS
jgi:hypothetical protein